jgi:hypothetical protein
VFGFLRASAKSAVHGGCLGLLRAFDFAERHGCGILFHFEIVPQASALPAFWTAARISALLTFSA